MDYKPMPIDTSNIEPDESLQELMEKLAENVHEVWAKNRMAEGWIYGSKRNDIDKHHPCLINYNSLSEEEKNYDRNTASETIKFIISMGYSIIPPEFQCTQSSSPQLCSLADRLSLSSPINLSELQKIWEKHDEEQWETMPDLYRLLAERIIRAGEPLLAYDILIKGLKCFSVDEINLHSMRSGKRMLYVRLRQLLGLALAQSGSTARACQILLDLYHQGLRDGETLGILGRTYKDMGLAQKDKDKRLAKFDKAFGYYHEAFKIASVNDELDGAYYNGINAATLALLSGRKDQAAVLAEKVTDICNEKIKNCKSHEKNPDYWVYATLGEACLILNCLDDAEKWYKKASCLARGNFRDISAMRRQARLLTEYFKNDPKAFDSCFPVPSVAVLYGHMSGITEPLSLSCENETREKIACQLKKLNAGIGYVSILEIEDFLFAEEILKLPDGEVNLVLPLSKDDMQQAIIGNFVGKGWEGRFNRIIKGASKVFELSVKCDLGNRRNLEFADVFMKGMATLRSRWLDTDIHFLGVETGYDGSPGDIPVFQREQSYDIKGLNKNKLFSYIHDSIFKPVSLELSEDILQQKAASRHIYSMLFADVKNYSKLNENQLLMFARYFLHRTAKIINPYKDHIISKKTAGDGFFIVFQNVIAALNCAVDFRNSVSRIKWEAYGLPQDLEVRISLDAGPIYSYHDPVAEQTDFCGKYVIRAARIEPITPPGEIYTSESFAALAVSLGADKAEFDYAGQIRLAKDYGLIPVYHVQRRSIEETGK
ncbi:TRAFs-binding domain-containing protein [Desulfobacterales bacterium HSG17]|nr:TRAFs-binding domain-containing protein [Desulfobacterales bacterium HSG17]